DHSLRRGDPRRLSRAQRPLPPALRLPRQDHQHRRRDRLGRMLRLLPRGLPRRQGPRGRHGRDRCGPRRGADRNHLAAPQGPQLVVRHRRGARLHRDQRNRHRALGSQGPGPGPLRPRPPGRARPRPDARRGLHPRDAGQHPRDGGGDRGPPLRRPPGRQGRLRQEGRRAPRLRPRPRRRIRPLRARGDRGQAPDDRSRRQEPLGHRHRPPTRPRLRGLRHPLARRAPRPRRPGGLPRPTRRHHAPHRLRGAGVESPRRAAHRGDGHRGRDRPRPRPDRGDYRLPQGRRDLRHLPPPSQCPQLLHRHRLGGQPSPQLREPRLPRTRTPARLRPRAGRPRGPPRLAHRRLGEPAPGPRPRHPDQRGPREQRKARPM
ncbi:MAG: hypothetical protein AVDCRST_MAG15-606, partial [uncultured Rubellimicrobium sp.]